MSRTGRARGWTRAWLVAAVLASGCQNTQGDLSQVLRQYVIAQEMYYAQHQRYAPNPRSLTRGLAVPPWMRVQVHGAGAAGHSAHAWSIRAPEQVCVVFAGPLPPGLEQGFPGEPMCGAPTEFGAFLSGWVPPRNARARRWPRAVSIVGGIVLVFVLLAAAYRSGVFLDRVGRTRPWIWAGVFRTPAVLVTGFVGLSAGLGPVLRRSGGYGWSWVAVGLAFGAVLNLGSFLVPRALRRPRSEDWWVTLGLLAVAATAYAAFTKVVAGDVSAGGRFAAGTNFATVTLAFGAGAMSLLNVMGLVQLIRARRRATPGATPDADRPARAGRGSPGGTWKGQKRRLVLLAVALAVSVFYLVYDRNERSREEAAPDRVRGFLASYVMLQEAYHADHGRYAAAGDRGAIPVAVGVTLRIISSSATAHSAIAYTDSTQRLCAVWVGEPLPQLDHDRQAEPVCDAPPRFEPWLVAAARDARGGVPTSP